MELNFKDYLDSKSKLVNQALERFFPEVGKGIPILRESMRYSLMAGGKRLRPVLCILSYELTGGEDVEEILPCACALEMIHTFTLIHDDLPAMDNDDYRRGMLTNHKVYGEAMAILAGDALFIEAIGLFLKSPAEPQRKVRMLEELVEALGVNGVIGGQILDIRAEGKAHSPELVKNIHLRKTAKFIMASLSIGAIGAGADGKLLDDIRVVGEKMGLLFQIVDDILDEVSDEEVLGKKAKKDRERGKCTYPSVFGLDVSMEQARFLVKEIEEFVISQLGERYKILVDVARFFLEREK